MSTVIENTTEVAITAMRNRAPAVLQVAHADQPHAPHVSSNCVTRSISAFCALRMGAYPAPRAVRSQEQAGSTRTLGSRGTLP